MNVVILADLFVKSGVGKYIYELSSSLSERGNNVYIVSPVIDWELPIKDNLKFIKIDRISKNPKNIILNINKLKNIIDYYHIDIIHTNHRMSSLLAHLMNLFCFRRIPIIWTCHTVPYPTNFIKKIFGYNGNKTIAISLEAIDFCKNTLKIKEKNIIYINNGVDNNELQQLSDEEKERIFLKYNIPRNKKIIAIHGRIDRVKGHDLLINALKEMNPKDLDKIVVLCSGNCNEFPDYYNQLIESISECKNLHWIFTGWIDTRSIFGISDLVVQPSRREGFLLTSIEAMFMKVPLIRTKTGGYECMKEFCVGIDIDSKEQLKDAILDYLTNSNYYKKIAEKAYYEAINKYTLEIMVNKTIDAYKKTIKGD